MTGSQRRALARLVRAGCTEQRLVTRAEIVLTPVAWAAVVPLGVGCLIGSRLGPLIVRHAPATPLRLLIAVAGPALAVKLGFDAYR